MSSHNICFLGKIRKIFPRYFLLSGAGVMLMHHDYLILVEKQLKKKTQKTYQCSALTPFSRRSYGQVFGDNLGYVLFLISP